MNIFRYVFLFLSILFSNVFSSDSELDQLLQQSNDLNQASDPKSDSGSISNSKITSDSEQISDSNVDVERPADSTQLTVVMSSPEKPNIEKFLSLQEWAKVKKQYESFVVNIKVNNGVLEIPDAAFQNCTKLESIQLPENLKKIGFHAFYNCQSLEEINIPAIEEMGSSAFAECTNLTTVKFSKEATLRKLPDMAFEGCIKLKNLIDFPNSVSTLGKGVFSYTKIRSFQSNYVKKIGEKAFFSCKNLVEVSLPNINEIPQLAFYACSQLKNIDLSRIFIIGDYAFFQCEALDNIVLWPGETIGEKSGHLQLGDYAFSKCRKLCNIKLPERVFSFGKAIFEDCSALEEIKLPYIVNEKTGRIPDRSDIKSHTISHACFSGCVNLRKVYVHSSINHVGNKAFYNCNNLLSIVHYETKLGQYTETPVRFQGIGKDAFNGCCKLAIDFLVEGNPISFAERSFKNCCNLKSAYIPENIGNISSIPPEAFSGCISLETVTFASNSKITSIGAQAFMDCQNLKKISIPQTVTSIGSKCFYGCISLTNITIPDKVTQLSDATFKDCVKLQSISGKNVTTVGKEAFRNTALDAIPSFHKKWTVIQSGTFKQCAFLKEIDISKMQSIEDYAFAKCSNLETVTSASCNFGSYVFSKCSKLKKFNNSIFNQKNYFKNKIVPEGTFKDCTSLTTFDLPKVQTIEKEAFSGCTALENVTMPKSLTKIDDRAFWWCKKLLLVEPTLKVDVLGTECFFGAQNLNLTCIACPIIPEKAFSYCNGLTNLTIEAKEIQNEAFTKCPNLSYVKLSNNLECIGDFAFSGCEKLVPYFGNKPTDQQIEINFGNIRIGKQAFLNSLVTPNYTFGLNLSGVSSLGEAAFQGGSSITCVILNANQNIPQKCFMHSGVANVETVQSEDPHKKRGSFTCSTIGASAFSGTKLEYVTLESVQIIEESAFLDCPLKFLHILNPNIVIAKTAFQSAARKVFDPNAVILPKSWCSDCTDLSQENIKNILDQHNIPNHIAGYTITCEKDLTLAKPKNNP